MGEAIFCRAGLAWKFLLLAIAPAIFDQIPFPANFDFDLSEDI